MDDVLEKSLNLLELSPEEIKIFRTSYKIGSATIPEIAKTAHIKRSTAYLLIQALLIKQLLVQDQKSYAKKVQTIDPNDLLRLISSKQRKLRRQELELEKALPSLRTFYQASSVRPKIRLFEGNSGLLSIWYDILSTSQEILLWTNQQTENKVFGHSNHEKFIAERIRKHIKIRVLATNTPEAKNLQAADTTSLRQTKLLPISAAFSCETYIYDNKVAMLDYNKDIIGIITESVPFTNFHRSNFELIWSSLP